MLPMQTNKGADGADEAFGGIPVRDDLTGQHSIEQTGQLLFENTVHSLRDGLIHSPFCRSSNCANCCLASHDGCLRCCAGVWAVACRQPSVTGTGQSTAVASVRRRRGPRA